MTDDRGCGASPRRSRQRPYQQIRFRTRTDFRFDKVEVQGHARRACCAPTSRRPPLEVGKGRSLSQRLSRQVSGATTTNAAPFFKGAGVTTESNEETMA